MADKRLSTACSKCPVCGKPRGPATDHGACMEIRAKTEGKEGSGVFNSKLREFSVQNVKNSKLNKVKKRYLKGDLPDWMFS